MTNWLKVWLEPPSGLALLIAYVLLGGVIYAIQLPAIPGFILMVLAAPLWIGLLVHVAMAQFAWFALRGMISRAWLVLPLAIYGGGLALHFASVRAAEAEAAAINARNAAVQLNVETPFRYLREGSADSFPLLEHYRMDSSFLRQGNDVTATYYARGEACDNALQGYYYKRRQEPWALRKDIFYFYHGTKTRQCILSQVVSSVDWRYRIKGNYTYAKDRASQLFERWGKAFEIYDERENRLLGTIEVVTFRPFPIVPLIIAGCGLNSGAATWQCGFGLAKAGPLIAAGYKARAADDPQKNPFTPSLDAETWEVTQLARALGLEPRQPTD